MKGKHKSGGNTAITEVTLVFLTFKDLLLPKHHASRMLSPDLVRRAYDTVDFLSSTVEPNWPAHCDVFSDARDGFVEFHYAVDVTAPRELIERAGIALDYGFSDMGVAVTLDVICTATLLTMGGSEPGIVTRAKLEGLVALLPEEPED